MVKIKSDFKFPKVRINLKYTVLVLLIIIAIAGSIKLALWYLETTEVVEVTSVVVDKYSREEISHYTNVGTEDNPINIPQYEMEYYLELENGTTRNVSQTTFNKYKVGDSYTYKVRVWK